MDIAEIRKKAKAAPAKPLKAPAEVEISGVSPAASAPVPASAGVSAAAGLTPPAVIAPPGFEAALDRLFAPVDQGGDGNEENGRTALVSQQVADDAEFSQFLAFQLGSEEYALDIARISEIIKPREFTDIPRVPDYILGLLSLRGVVVPIFDLQRRFKLGEVTIDSASRIIVCREGEVAAGLLVDGINQVVRIASDRIEPPPAVLTGIDRNLIEGVGRYQGRMIILLHLANVLDVAMA